MLSSLERNFTLAKEQLAKQQEDPTYKSPNFKGMYPREWGWPCYHDCISSLTRSTNTDLSFAMPKAARMKGV